MPSIEDWVTYPLGIIQTLFDRSKNFESSQVREYFGEKLKTKNAVSWIPSLNDTPLHDVKPNSLVRFRCMIQDMFDPEFYLGLYEVEDNKTGQKSMRSGKYKDVAECGVNETINPDSKSNVTMDRMTLYCVPVPGEAVWVKEAFAEISSSKTGPSPSSSKTPIRSKRSLEEESEGQGQGDVPMEGDFKAASTTADSVSVGDETDGKKLQTQKQGTSTSAGPDLNFPIPGETGTPCLVKVYDDINSFKVNDVVEFVGILSVDPSLASFQDNSSEDSIMGGIEESAEERYAHAPPPSLVPRLHVVLANHLSHINPYIPDYKQEDFKQASSDHLGELEGLRGELLSVLEHAVFGDKLAAEYFLCHLIAGVYGRADVMPLGKFSMNLSNCPRSASYSDLLHHLISNLVTQSHLLPMSLHNMNEHRFSPHKDYTANRLRSGILQLADHTNLVIDETKLEPGQLDTTGVRNIQALGNLISWQKVEYDFNFHKQDFLANVSVLVLSEGKSLLPSDCLLPINPTAIPDQMREYFTQLDTKLSPVFLRKCRSFVGVTRGMEYSLTDDMQKVIQEDFVNLRKEDPKNMTVDDFHSLLSLTRLLSLSQLKSAPTMETWRKAKAMERERKLRISQIAARHQANTGS